MPTHTMYIELHTHLHCARMYIPAREIAPSLHTCYTCRILATLTGCPAITSAHPNQLLLPLPFPPVACLPPHCTYLQGMFILGGLLLPLHSLATTVTLATRAIWSWRASCSRFMFHNPLPLVTYIPATHKLLLCTRITFIVA